VSGRKGGGWKMGAGEGAAGGAAADVRLGWQIWWMGRMVHGGR